MADCGADNGIDQDKNIKKSMSQDQNISLLVDVLGTFLFAKHLAPCHVHLKI